MTISSKRKTTSARRPDPFLDDQRGAAAAEFALILPVLIAIMCGLFDFAQAFEVRRKVAIAAYEITDLVSRQPSQGASSLPLSQLTSFLNAGTQIVSPFPGSALAITISEVTTDSNANTKVTWSQTVNGTALAAGSSYALPSNLVVKGASLIVGQVSYPFAPAIGSSLIGPITFSRVVYEAPRGNQSTVPLDTSS